MGATDFKCFCMFILITIQLTRIAVSPDDESDYETTNRNVRDCVLDNWSNENVAKGGNVSVI